MEIQVSRKDGKLSFNVQSTRSRPVRAYAPLPPPVFSAYQAMTQRVVSRLLAENAHLRRHRNLPPSAFVRLLLVTGGWWRDKEASMNQSTPGSPR